jgi:hypothetical protein
LFVSLMELAEAEPAHRFAFQLRVLEIRGHDVRDLLAGLQRVGPFGRTRRCFERLVVSDDNALALPLVQLRVGSEAQLAAGMRHAAARRSWRMGAKGAREHARTSHLVVSLAVQCSAVRPDPAADVGAPDQPLLWTANLHLADLATSELCQPPGEGADAAVVELLHTLATKKAATAQRPESKLARLLTDGTSVAKPMVTHLLVACSAATAHVAPTLRALRLAHTLGRLQGDATPANLSPRTLVPAFASPTAVSVSPSPPLPATPPGEKSELQKDLERVASHTGLDRLRWSSRALPDARTAPASAPAPASTRGEAPAAASPFPSPSAASSGRPPLHSPSSSARDMIPPDDDDATKRTPPAGAGGATTPRTKGEVPPPWAADVAYNTQTLEGYRPIRNTDDMHGEWEQMLKLEVQRAVANRSGLSQPPSPTTLATPQPPSPRTPIAPKPDAAAAPAAPAAGAVGEGVWQSHPSEVSSPGGSPWLGSARAPLPSGSAATPGSTGRRIEVGFRGRDMKSPVEAELVRRVAPAWTSSGAAVWRLRDLRDPTLWRRLAAFDMDAFSSVPHLERAANALLAAALEALRRPQLPAAMLRDVQPFLFPFLERLQPHDVLEPRLLAAVFCVYVREAIMQPRGAGAAPVPPLVRPLAAFLSRQGGIGGSGSGRSQPLSTAASAAVDPHTDAAPPPPPPGTVVMHLERSHLVAAQRPDTADLFCGCDFLCGGGGGGVDGEDVTLTAAALGRLRDDAECSAVGNHWLAASVAALSPAEASSALRDCLQLHFPFLATESGGGGGGGGGPAAQAAEAIWRGWMEGLCHKIMGDAPHEEAAAAADAAEKAEQEAGSVVGKCAFELVLDRCVWTRLSARVHALRAGLAAVPEEVPSDAQLAHHYHRRLGSFKVEGDNIMALLLGDERLSSKLSRHGQTVVRHLWETSGPNN